MPDTGERREREQLTHLERSLATVVAIAFLVVAVWLTVAPPDRRVALAGCENAAAGCVVTVDGDSTTVVAAVAALGVAAGLIALLGVRFTSVKAGGFEFAYAAKTAGMASAGPQPPPPPEDRRLSDPATGPMADKGVEGSESKSPLRVDLRTGLGTELGVVPVAVASLAEPMEDSQAPYLRDYQGARRVSQNGWFLTHILGAARSPGQRYSVAITVTPHDRAALEEVRAARFYLGRAWGHRVFIGRKGPDGHFGITTEAYGPFLVLCEVEFTSGLRILLDHYCDFEMGSLVTG